MIPAEVKQAIIQQLQTMDDDLTGYTIVLFGSRAAHKAQPRSDFDVGVLGKRPMPPSLFYQIEEKFDKIETLYTIDWVDLTQTSDDFRREALKEIEVLYEG